MLNNIHEDQWQYTEAIALLAAIAGLFHDFGKANKLFQKKLVDENAPKSEPIRHEWVSARLFEAFVNSRPDNEWLKALSSLSPADSREWIERTQKDGTGSRPGNPLWEMEQPVARAVCWLILTHHRLPSTTDGSAGGNEVEKWPRRLRPHWNSPQFKKHTDTADFEPLWEFEHGLPVASNTWRTRAASLAKRALNLNGFCDNIWFNNTFCMHIARCALMLADHCYSGGNTTQKWQDPQYTALANTRLHPAGNSLQRSPHQKLDEHCIGVAHYAYLFARSIPRLRALLPAIDDVRALRKNATGTFSWQNRAYNLAQKAADHSVKNGGFFVNMASTGTGKTVANARMAYALNKPNDGCRFSILLGLRTLTLQTGDALRQRIGLSDGELGVLIGSSVIKELHENNTGAESASPLIEENSHIYYDGELTQSRFGQWLGQQGSSKLQRLLSAPVLVSTIDYLMPATESKGGGHQIAPMLRLLGSDIILDEPDDFGLPDQPALCRLVYWAGMLGSRVILSSATLSPALIEALFTAYTEGRSLFNEATNLPTKAPISCGWVDEFNTQITQANTSETFVEAHQEFVQKRLNQLAKMPSKRHAALLKIAEGKKPQVSIATTILNGVQTLHTHHHQVTPNGKQRVSIGLVRMANINPLVAVTRELMQMDVGDETEIHVCVYHSRHPLLRRYLIEKNLDSLLNRNDPDALWQHPAISNILNYHTAPNQIFLVLATAVAEVGRDHCYDWAIVEPSSMRSIVQLAGRVMRHRPYATPNQPNILILEQNYRALNGKTHSFQKPGYESAQHPIKDHNLSNCLPKEHYQYPSPASCIQSSDQPQPDSNLADLEHAATRANLIDNPPERWPASLWWRAPVRWCYQMQVNTRFRKGDRTQLFALITEDINSEPQFYSYLKGEWKPAECGFHRDQTIELSNHLYWWLHSSDTTLVEALSDDPDHDLTLPSQRQLSFELPEYPGQNNSVESWHYHPVLGLYRVL